MSRASRGEGGDLPGGPCFFHDQENLVGQENEGAVRGQYQERAA